MYRRACLVAFTTLSLAILGDSPASAAAAHSTDTQRIQFVNEEIGDACTGHIIEFSGTLLQVVQLTVNDKIVTVHIADHVTGMTGVDEMTGERVRWTEVDSNHQAFFRTEEKFEFATTLTSRFARPGPHNDSILRGHIVSVIDANGVQRVDISQFDTVCR